MKKLLCFLLCLTLIFLSISLCFAADAQWSTSDSQNLQYIANRLYYSNNSAAYYLYNIATNTQNTYNKLVDVYNALFYGNHNITYWVNSISTWMSPIYNAITNIPVDLSTIIGALGYTDSNQTYHPYLNEINNALSRYTGSYSTAMWEDHAHAFIGDSSDSWYQFPAYRTDNTTGNYNVQWKRGTPIGNLALMLKYHASNVINAFSNLSMRCFNGYGNQQDVVSWTDLSTSNFTPLSMADGLYKYLDNIQNPVARLSYVLASNERIEAQEAAAANEEAVVDNFIDSTGDGAASPSDIGSVSDLSSGYKQNFGTDASPSGIFDIFNSDHATWFSQETKNQLDTTTPTRLTKGSESNTPLLDKQIEDIYKALGVKQQ